MSAQINVCKAGLVPGFVLGGWHLCWSILVALGWAQAVIDFVFWMHFIKRIYVIEPFGIARAAILIVVTASMGFVIGSVFALAWNALHKRRNPLTCSRLGVGTASLVLSRPSHLSGASIKTGVHGSATTSTARSLASAKWRASETISL